MLNAFDVWLCCKTCTARPVQNKPKPKVLETLKYGKTGLDAFQGILYYKGSIGFSVFLIGGQIQFYDDWQYIYEYYYHTTDSNVEIHYKKGTYSTKNLQKKQTESFLRHIRKIY